MTLIADRVARRFVAKGWWQGMAPRERREYQKANRKRPSQRTIDQLNALLPQASAFGSFEELERDMIQHGYLPTTKNRKLRKLLDSVGLPYFGVLPPPGEKVVKKPKVYVVVRRAGGALEMQRWKQEQGERVERVLEFDIGISDEKLFENFPWRMIDGLGNVKEEERWFGQDFWHDTIFVKPYHGTTREDIADMKGEVERATAKFQAANPEVDVVLKMRKGVG